MTGASLLAIFAMGAITYATRAGGFWLASRVRPDPFLRTWLDHLPGAVFAALVAPMALTAGPAGWVGAAAAFATARLGAGFVPAILAGMAAYLLARDGLGLGSR
jgi:branched chain amino acid efflux pump